MSKYLKWAAASLIVSLLAAPALAPAPALASPTTHPVEGAKARPAKSGGDWVMRTAQSGQAKLEKGQYAEALVDFADIRDSDTFAILPERQKFGIYFAIGLCEQMLGQYEASLTDLRMAATISPGMSDKDRGFYYWGMLLDANSRLKKVDVAIQAMTVIAADFPENLKDLPYTYISGIVREAIPLSGGNERRLHLLEALRKADYRSESFASEEDLWFELMALYVDKGDMTSAKTIAVSLDDPRLIIRMRVDKRYRPLVDADPARYDLTKAIDQSINKARKAASARPRAIEGAIALSHVLMETNHTDEALTVIDTAIKTAEAAPKDKPAFDDLARKLDWAYDMRTRLMALSGQDKAELKAQTKARDVAQDNNTDPVSHAVNLGDYYYQHDQPKEALEAIANIPTDKASPYGVMAIEVVRACAYAGLGDKEGLAKSLSYMHAHAIDGYIALRGALLCAGDVDALTAVMLDQLKDPKTRNDALVRYQGYLKYPDRQPTEFSKRAKTTIQALHDRKDIREAVELYGYTESYPMYAPEAG